MIADAIREFIRDPAVGDFNELAVTAFRFQVERLDAYRRLCHQAGIEPEDVTDWRQIPPVPTLAYKSLDLGLVDDGEVFRSSGTTGSERSVHRHGFLDLYRQTIDTSFPASVLGSSSPMSMLSLIPSRAQVPDSSLSFMVDHVLQRFGAAASVTAFGDRGVDARTARSHLAASQRSGEPLLILATAFSLVDLLQALERLNLRFRLPAGSVVFETGGYKGRSRELTREQLIAQLQDRLGVGATQVVREYGMTELTSQFYTGSLRGGDPTLFLPSHWTRVRVLDPETLDEQPDGETGLVAILDLANLSSAVHLLTQDLGLLEGNGFRLEGRAGGAELRGCSLTVEELGRI